MSEIVLAIGLWSTVFLQANDPYQGKKLALLGFYVATAVGFSIYGLFQLGRTDFFEVRAFPLFMAIWIPVSTLAYNTRALAVILQHGEASLQRKYGAPSLNLELLEDWNLARKVKFTQYAVWSIVAMFVIGTGIRYVQIAT